MNSIKPSHRSKLTILITGATAGIGRHAALDLARAGHRVFATGRRVAALEKLREDEPRIETLVLDVTDAKSIAAASYEIDRITDGYGVDVLVNNAGYGLVGPLESVSDADIRAQFETNVFGLMAMTRAFLPRMRERLFGRVINVSSMGGRVTFPFMGAYNATKYAVESLSDALRNEVAPFGVGVVLIEPGAIHTEFAAVAMVTAEKYKGAPSAYSAVLARSDALQKRMMSTAVGPEHVTRAIRKAIEAKNPSARYVTPWRIYFALTLFTILPTSWTDRLLRALLGLNRSLVAGPTKTAEAAA